MQGLASSSSLQFRAYPNSFLPADPDVFILQSSKSEEPKFLSTAFESKVPPSPSRDTITDL
jgi:hypothetical protein